MIKMLKTSIKGTLWITFVLVISSGLCTTLNDEDVTSFPPTEVIGDFTISLRVANKCPIIAEENATSLLSDEDPDCSAIQGDRCDDLQCGPGHQCCFDACALVFVCMDNRHMVHSESCVVHHEGTVKEYPAGSVFSVSRGLCKTCVCAEDGEPPYCRDLQTCDDPELPVLDLD